MAERIALVERPEQLAAVPAGFEPISTDPLVDVHGKLDRPEDHVSADELERIGAENFGRVDELCALLDEGRGLAPAGWHVWWLKLMIDALMARRTQLERLIEDHGAREVACFRRADPLPPGSELVSLEESLYAALAPTLAVPVRILDSPPPERSAGPPRRSSPLAGLLRDRMTGIAARRPGWRRATVLCLDLGYGVGPIARELVRAGTRVWLWGYGTWLHELGSLRTARVPDAPPVEAGHWKDDTRVRELFRREGLDVWPAAEPRLRGMVEGGFPETIAVHRRVEALLERVRPDAVLLSTATYPREKAACAVAETHGVPTIVSRHGEMGIREVPMTELEDVNTVDWSLAWGSFEAGWTERRTRHGTRAAVTGSPQTEREVRTAPARPEVRRRLGIGERERVVLFVPTNLSGNHWYGSNRAPTDGAYFEHVRSIAAALLELEGTRLLVKEHPAVVDSPIERWLQGRADVIREPAFPQLIHVADAMVLDTPSTTLVQAVFGSGRIYLTAHPQAVWVPEAREHLERHGIPVCEGAEVAALIARDAPAGAHRYLDEAIEPLASHGREGRAAARAAAIVQDISRGCSPRAPR